MKHSIPHDLDIAKAKLALQKALDAYKAKFPEYHPDYTWTSENKATIKFSAKGITLNGAVAVHPNHVDLELDVPFIFNLFKGRAMGVIESEFKEWVGRAKKGEL